MVKEDTINISSKIRQHIIDTWDIGPWGCLWSNRDDGKCGEVEDCSYCPFYSGNSAFNITDEEMSEWFC